MNFIQNHNVVIVWLDSSAIFAPYFWRPRHVLHLAQGRSIVCCYIECVQYTSGKCYISSEATQSCSVECVQCTSDTVRLIRYGTPYQRYPILVWFCSKYWTCANRQSCDPDFLYEVSFFYRELATSYALSSILYILRRFFKKNIWSKFETLTATEF